MQYDKCPRQYADGVWWDSVELGVTAWKPCPGVDASGRASRTCGDRGWVAPDMFNCTSRLFVQLQEQIQQLQSGDVILNTYQAKRLAEDLYNATNKTLLLRGTDVSTANQLLVLLLAYENQQSGLNLTHTQDRNFIQVRSGIFIVLC